jgi:hypothetical protein
MPEQRELETFIALVESNQHAEAIERFYDEDASMQENLDPPRRGRTLLVDGERAFLTRWAKVQSQCVRPVFVNGDQLVVRWIFTFTDPAGKTLTMDELAYQRWRGNKIVEERFYYDPKQMRG